MTSSQMESHFARKRSYDDVEDGQPQLMNVAGSGAQQNAPQTLLGSMGGVQRGSEDERTYSQDSTLTSQHNGVGQAQQSSMGNGQQKKGDGSRQSVGMSWVVHIPLQPRDVL